MNLKRSPMKRKQIKRYWEDAYEKIRHEYVCRYCKRGEVFDWTLSGCIYDLHMGEDRIEAAHVIGRKYQDEVTTGPRGAKRLYVNPNSIIPLCSQHHRAYDARQISILGLLTFSELVNAARACKKYGINCRRRLTGGTTS